MGQIVEIDQEIAVLVKELTTQQKRDLLSYVRSMKNRPDPEPGWRVIEHAKQLGFSREDLAEMQQAIEDAFERVSDAPEVNLDE